MKLSVGDWIKLGVGVKKIIDAHSGVVDINKVVAGAHEALGIANDVMRLVDTVRGDSLKGVVSNPTVKHTANEALEYVKAHGLNDQEQAILDRASNTSGL